MFTNNRMLYCSFLINQNNSVLSVTVGVLIKLLSRHYPNPPRPPSSHLNHVSALYFTFSLFLLRVAAFIITRIGTFFQEQLLGTQLLLIFLNKSGYFGYTWSPFMWESSHPSLLTSKRITVINADIFSTGI